jgi:hypothetical protein
MPPLHSFMWVYSLFSTKIAHLYGVNQGQTKVHRLHGFRQKVS